MLKNIYFLFGFTLLCFLFMIPQKAYANTTLIVTSISDNGGNMTGTH